MKRAIMFIFVLLVLATVGGAIVISQINPGIIRDKLAATSIAATGKPLQIKSMPSISIFPPGVSFGEASWGMVDGKPAQSGISASAAGGLLLLQLKPLLSGRIYIEELRLESPTLFIRPKAEVTDLKAGKDLPPQKENEPFPLELAKLEIKNGSVDYSAEKENDIRLEKIMLRISDLKLGSVFPASFSCDFALSDPEMQGSIQSGFNITLQNDKISLNKGQLAFTPHKMPKAYDLGPFKLKFDIEADHGTGNAEINISSDAVGINKIELRNLKAKLNILEGLYAVNPLEFDLKEGGHIFADISSRSGLSKHNIILKTNEVAIGPIMHALQGARPVEGSAAFSAELSASGKDAKAIQSSLAGKGLLSIKEITLNNISLLPLDAAGLPGTTAVPARFDQLSAPFTVAKGIIQINPITLNSTTVNAYGQGHVNLPREHLSIAAEIKLAGISLPVTAEGNFNNIVYGVNKNKLLQDSVNPRNLLDTTRGTGGKIGEGTRDIGRSLKNLLR